MVGQGFNVPTVKGWDTIFSWGDLPLVAPKGTPEPLSEAGRSLPQSDGDPEPCLLDKIEMQVYRSSQGQEYLEELTFTWKMIKDQYSRRK
jgi:hypothetical protein